MRGPVIRRTIALVLIAVLQGIAGHASAADVTACGQLVARGDVGVLQVDLDCTGGPRVCVNSTLTPCETADDCNDPVAARLCASLGVVVGKGATLNLNGHSIAADGQTGYGVWCAEPNGRQTGNSVPCTVYGPGDVGGGALGIGSSKLTIHDVSVHGARIEGIFGADGVNAAHVTVDHVGEVGGGYAGIYTAKRLQALNLTVNDNTGIGILAGSVRGTTVTANGNSGPGVQTYGQITVTGLTAQNNGEAGVYSYGGGKLVDSVVTGNPYDLLMHARPRVENTTCDLSARLPDKAQPVPTGTWGVCAGD